MEEKVSHQDNINVVLQRLGIETGPDTVIDETVIKNKVLSNPEFTSEYEKEIKSKQDVLLVNKLKKVLQKYTGIAEEEIKDDVDFDKLVSKALSRITPKDDLEDVFRSKELEYEKKIEEYQEALRKKDEEVKSKILDFKLNTKANIVLNSLTLIPQAKENLQELKDTAVASVLRKYTFKEVEGQLVAYNEKGEKLYKKGTSFPILFEDAITEYAERFGFIQKTEVNVDPLKTSKSSSLTKRVYKF